MSSTSGSIREKLLRVLQSAIIILVGFLVGGFFMMATGHDPIVAYSAMFFGSKERGMEGAFGGMLGITSTIREASFIILTGLAVQMAFSAGVFNVGVEGAMYIGAFVSFLVGYTIALPLNPVTNLVHALLAIGAAMLAGAAWMYIPTYLKIKRSAHEVVTTIMLNYIATSITELLVVTFFLPQTGIPPGGILTPDINPSAMVPQLPLLGANLSLGIIPTLTVAVLLFITTRRSVIGYSIRAVGSSPKAARYGGIDVEKIVLLVMLAGGAMAGLAGSIDVQFTEYRFSQSFSPGYGFSGIPVALIGRLDVAGIILAGLFMSALHIGALSIQPVTGMPREISMLIEGLIVISAALPGAMELITSHLRARREKK